MKHPDPIKKFNYDIHPQMEKIIKIMKRDGVRSFSTVLTDISGTKYTLSITTEK